MIPESSRPAVPPHLTAAGREPHDDPMPPSLAFAAVLVLLVVAGLAGTGLAWLVGAL